MTFIVFSWKGTTAYKYTRTQLHNVGQAVSAEQNVRDCTVAQTLQYVRI
jgi:hypothetical protein